MQTIFSQPDIFASHPANHGKWQFDDKHWLFGCLTGERGHGTFHNIKPPYTKILFRTKDAGQTWCLEKPNVDFECTKSYPLIPDCICPPHCHDECCPVCIPGPQEYQHDFNLNDYIVRVCGEYDTGGEFCELRGGFYISKDYGKEWCGPFLFRGLEHLFNPPFQNTSRTCQLGDLLFVSSREIKEWGSDDVYCVEYTDGKFQVRSCVCSDDNRSVMPSACRADEDILFCAVRRKGGGHNAVQVFKSVTNGKSWFNSEVFDTGNNNGNPPAILFLDGVIYLTYCNRYYKTLHCSMSNDLGRSWKTQVIAKDVGSDIGYPVLFGNSQVGPVCIIYSDGAIVQYNLM